MLYVALMKVDKPYLWHIHSGPTTSCYKSTIETKKDTVKKWLEKELKKYPDARVNEAKADKKYLITTAILAFDEKESTNIEMFLEKSFFFN